MERRLRDWKVLLAAGFSWIRGPGRRSRAFLRPTAAPRPGGPPLPEGPRGIVRMPRAGAFVGVREPGAAGVGESAALGGAVGVGHGAIPPQRVAPVWRFHRTRQVLHREVSRPVPRRGSSAPVSAVGRLDDRHDGLVSRFHRSGSPLPDSGTLRGRCDRNRRRVPGRPRSRRHRAWADESNRKWRYSAWRGWWTGTGSFRICPDAASTSVNAAAGRRTPVGSGRAGRLGAEDGHDREASRSGPATKVTHGQSGAYVHAGPQLPERRRRLPARARCARMRRFASPRRPLSRLPSFPKKHGT